MITATLTTMMSQTPVKQGALWQLHVLKGNPSVIQVVANSLAAHVADGHALHKIATYTVGRRTRLYRYQS